MSYKRGSTRVFVPGVLTFLVIAMVTVAVAQTTSAPTTGFTTENEFLTRGLPLNGATIVSSPAELRPDGQWHRSGASALGFIGRARLTNPDVGLGSFSTPWLMMDGKQGAGAVLARGPVPVDAGGAPLGPPRDTITYLYIVGGLTSGGVTGIVERAAIDADGGIYPGIGSNVAGHLFTPRYGAAVVAWGDYLYVLGGYDAQHTAIGSIERARIDLDGNLGVFEPVLPASAVNNSGDVAAVIVNGYLYVIGGNAGLRAPSETGQVDVRRIEILPNGDLGAAETLASLPAATAGGRVVVVATMSLSLVYNLYYLGGNVGDELQGASVNVYRLTVQADANTASSAWTSVYDGGQLVRLNDRRELFGVAATNGYVYAIGGMSSTVSATTMYSSVERARINPDGSLGQFTRLDAPRATYINGESRAADLSAIAVNNNIYVPGGVDISGGTIRSLFQLGLDQEDALLPGTVGDTAVLARVHDFGSDNFLNSMSFDIDMEPTSLADVRIRYRTAEDRGAPTWGPWSRAFKVTDLPFDRLDSGTGTVGRRYFVDLTYDPNAATLCDPNHIMNPSGIKGPLTTRWIEYEVLIPTGSASAVLNELRLNAHRKMYYALPGGFDPRLAGAQTCAPNNARADLGISAATDDAVGHRNGRILRVKGVGFPSAAEASDFRFTSANSNAPPVTIEAIRYVDDATIDLRISIGPATPGDPPASFTYDLVADGANFSEPLTLASALIAHPTVWSYLAPEFGLDADPGTAKRDNIVNLNALLQSDQQSVTLTLGVLGQEFRSGRIRVTGGTAVPDNAGTLAWPRGPMELGEVVPSGPQVMQYRLVDTTDGSLSSGSGWRDVVAKPASSTLPGFWDDTRLNIPLDVPANAKTGPHELKITLLNPQMGSTYEVTQTVYVVPKLVVRKVTTIRDTVGPHEWTGQFNPAHVDLADSIVPALPCMKIEGYGFKSSTTGQTLIRDPRFSWYWNVPDPGNAVGVIAPVPTAVRVNAIDNFELDTQLPVNGTAGLHILNFDWRYIPGTSDETGLVPPSSTDAIDLSWHPLGATTLGLYVAPPPVSTVSVFGSNSSHDPIVVLQSEPTLIVNGNGFATGNPGVGFGSIVTRATLRSLANSPAEDIAIPLSGIHMTSDRQLRLTFPLPEGQRAGQIYQLELETSISSSTRAPLPNPYLTTTRHPELITVLPNPVCKLVTRPACFAAKQGGSLTSVVVTGDNFDTGTRVDLGAGVTISNLRVTYDDPAGADDTATFDLAIAPDATPGRRSVVIDNGQSGAVPQRGACGTAFDLVVVPKPAFGSMQPAIIQQTPKSQVGRWVPIDVYGANFVNGAAITVTGPSPVTLQNPVVVNSEHLTAELRILNTTQAGTYTVSVSEPSGASCAPNPTASGTFNVEIFPEVTIAGVSGDRNLCQGGSGALHVAGTQFSEGLTATLGEGVAITSLVVESSESLRIEFGVSSSAVTGLHDLTLTAPLEGASPATHAGALMITSSPVVLSVSPGQVQLSSTREFSIAGSNFLPGTTVTVTPSDGIQVSSVSVVNAGQLVVSLMIEGTAKPGYRSITVINPDGGSCSTVTYSSAFRIIDPPHVVTMSMKKAKNAALKIEGTNFHPSLQVYIGGQATSWPYVTSKGNRIVTVKKAKDLFPSGAPVTLRLVNPDDGGETTVTFTR